MAYQARFGILHGMSLSSLNTEVSKSVPPSSPPLVLIVEDDDDVRSIVRELLEEHGYAVRVAVDGRDALDKLRTMPRPCLILLDWMMPVMNGEDVLNRLAADTALCTVPVVILSASAKAVKPGLRVLQKPISLESLLEVIKAHCGSGLSAVYA